MTGRPAATGLAALALMSAVALSGCDWEMFALLNSIPLPEADDRPETVYVYLGVDGLDHSTMLQARELGAFPPEDWDLSAFIPMFPASSFTSWTRLLQASPMNGYEYEYYDPVEDEVRNSGDIGLFSHLIPPLEGLGVDSPAFYRSFDQHSNGITEVLSNYTNTYTTLGRTLDGIFYVIDGKTQRSDVFAGYIPQTDIIGHTTTPQEVVMALMEVWDRIEAFKGRHSDRTWVFTLVADHGMNFYPYSSDELLHFDEILGNLGIRIVETLGPHQDAEELVAIPVLHSRVTYVHFHTPPHQDEEIARLLSTAEGVDFSVVRGPSSSNVAAEPALDWVVFWRDGGLLLEFGFDPELDRYHLPADQDLGLLGIALPPSAGSSTSSRVFTDEQLFGATWNSAYPDLFYRARTAFEPLSIRWPGDVLVSLEKEYVSSGFNVGEATDDVAAEGSHGAMIREGSFGTLLSEERALSPATRSDTFLDLFPRFANHIVRRGEAVMPGDDHKTLEYSNVVWTAPESEAVPVLSEQ